MPVAGETVHAERVTYKGITYVAMGLASPYRLMTPAHIMMQGDDVPMDTTKLVKPPWEDLPGDLDEFFNYVLVPMSEIERLKEPDADKRVTGVMRIAPSGLYMPTVPTDTAAVVDKFPEYRIGDPDELYDLLKKVGFESPPFLLRSMDAT